MFHVFKTTGKCFCLVISALLTAVLAAATLTAFSRWPSSSFNLVGSVFFSPVLSSIQRSFYSKQFDGLPTFLQVCVCRKEKFPFHVMFYGQESFWIELKLNGYQSCISVYCLLGCATPWDRCLSMWSHAWDYRTGKFPCFEFLHSLM